MVAVATVVTLSSCAQSKPGESRSGTVPAATAATASPAATRTGGTGSAHRPVTVVGIGDSVTAGSNCDCEAFVGLYASDLAAARGIKTASVNLGVGGSTSADLLTNLTQPGALRDGVAKADILLVTIGANDLAPLESEAPVACPATCYTPLINSAGHNVELIVDAARAANPAHPPTVLVTDYWNVFQDGDVGNAENGAAFQSWSDALTRAQSTQICQAAQSTDATCVSLYAPFKGNGSVNPTSLLAADGDHPNAAGHQLIASTLLAATARRLA
jgi:lysophospholipase L1-like esterase